MKPVIKKEDRISHGGVITYLMSNELQGKKWNELFEDEQDLLSSLQTMDINVAEKKQYKGIQYLRSFHRQLEHGRELSKAQMTALKRIAAEVYTYVWNERHTNWHNQ